MSVSTRTLNAMTEGGWIRRMFEIGIELKKEFGDNNVFDLSLGNPIMEPPAELREGLERMVTSTATGQHRYMPNAGYSETRTAVAEMLMRETGLAFTSSEIVMTCGAAGALNSVLETILNPGDEVIIFAPFFGEFTFYIENHQGVPIIAPTDASFLPNLNALETLISSRTRAVLINSPNNPSGALYPEKLISELGSLLGRKERQFGTEIFLLSDEPYRRIIFDGLSFPFIFKHHHAAIAIHSHSKDLAVPGERIGYLAVNPGYGDRSELLDGVIFWNRSLGYVNAPAIMQHLVQCLQDVTIDVDEYQRKRNFLYEQLTGLGYEIVKPHGAFYLFPRSLIDDDVKFVEQLQEHNVLTVPGTGFGSPGHFRISYCVEDRVLEGALEGFAKVAENIRN